MTNVRGNNGFSLIEFVAVLALVSGVLLTVTQLRGLQHQHNLQQSLLDTIDDVQVSLYGHFRQHYEFPPLLADIELSALAVTPWGEQMWLQHEHEDVALVIPTPNAKVLAWLQARLPRAQQAGQHLVLSVPRPVQALSADFALHRVAVSGRPELNEMQANLDMNGFALHNFSLLQAEQAEFEQVTVNDVVVATLTADEVWLSQQLTAVNASIEWLQADQIHVNNWVATQANVESLQVEQLHASTFTSEQLQASLLTTSELNAEQIITGSLHAGEISAADFVTEAASFNDMHERLQLLELAWISCVNHGGCR